MKKIMVLCGNGLGSSFMMEINVKKALKQLGKEANVDHTDLTTAKSETADIFIGAKDIMDNFVREGSVIIGLENIMSISDIKEKLSAHV
ncbi:MAG: PTS sugar transporter subunit IIB [Fusobacteriaceae bacterium]